MFTHDGSFDSAEEYDAYFAAKSTPSLISHKRSNTRHTKYERAKKRRFVVKLKLCIAAGISILIFTILILINPNKCAAAIHSKTI
jgi:hypothetical protein